MICCADSAKNHQEIQDWWSLWLDERIRTTSLGISISPIYSGTWLLYYSLPQYVYTYTYKYVHKPTIPKTSLRGCRSGPSGSSIPGADFHNDTITTNWFTALALPLTGPLEGISIMPPFIRVTHLVSSHIPIKQLLLTKQVEHNQWIGGGIFKLWGWSCCVLVYRLFVSISSSTVSSCVSTGPCSLTSCQLSAVST